jgi:hypothetical protein
MSMSNRQLYVTLEIKFRYMVRAELLTLEDPVSRCLVSLAFSTQLERVRMAITLDWQSSDIGVVN